MQRAYDQVIHDVALQKQKVILCLDRAGLVGEDGATHHGVFDLAYLRFIPNLVISAPYNEHDLRNLMYTAVYGNSGPFVIRYPRGQGELVNWKNEMKIIPIGKGRKLRDGKGIALISIGTIGNVGAAAIEKAKAYDMDIAHYDLLFLKPIDKELLREVAEKYSTIVTLEDGCIEGGMGSAVIEFFADNGYNNLNIHRLGIGDEFVTHGSMKELQHYCKIDEEGILESLINIQKLKEVEI